MTGSPRRLARELVLQWLYACQVEENDPAAVVAGVVADSDLPSRSKRFALELFEVVTRNSGWADEQISSLATNWNLDRLADIDRIILRMALAELKEVPDSPFKVVINEAIELARKFSTHESPAFINGILDAYVRRLTPSQETQPPTS